MTTEIIDAVSKSEIAAFSPFYADLATLEKDNAATVFDYESKAGNKDARSHVHKLRKTKGALEKVRKEAKADYLRLGRAVDSEASEIEARIESMIAVHQVKLDEIEQREAARVSALQERLRAISPGIEHYENSDAVRQAISAVEAVTITADWEEFMAQAATAKEQVLSRLNGYLLTAIKAEEDAAELARLRAETLAREQAERDAAIAKAAAEKAHKEAEEKAAQEAAKARQALLDAQAEADRKEAAAALALKQERERALAEQEAAALRESQLKIQAQQAEQRRIAQEQQAEQDRKDAIARAEQQAAAAVEAEKQRVAAEQAAESAEQAKRERNRAHKAKINRAALDSFMAGGMTEECAKLAVTLIASGKVANVSIAY
jgi:colicin import membrane protein